MAAAAAAQIASITVMTRIGLASRATVTSAGFVGVVNFMAFSAWFHSSSFTDTMDPFDSFGKR